MLVERIGPPLRAACALATHSRRRAASSRRRPAPRCSPSSRPPTLPSSSSTGPSSSCPAAHARAHARRKWDFSDGAASVQSGRVRSHKVSFAIGRRPVRRIRLGARPGYSACTPNGVSGYSGSTRRTHRWSTRWSTSGSTAASSRRTTASARTPRKERRRFRLHRCPAAFQRAACVAAHVARAAAAAGCRRELTALVIAGREPHARKSACRARRSCSCARRSSARTRSRRR